MRWNLTRWKFHEAKFFAVEFPAKKNLIFLVKILQKHWKLPILNIWKFLKIQLKRYRLKNFGRISCSSSSRCNYISVINYFSLFNRKNWENFGKKHFLGKQFIKNTFFSYFKRDFGYTIQIQNCNHDFATPKRPSNSQISD